MAVKPGVGDNSFLDKIPRSDHQPKAIVDGNSVGEFELVLASGAQKLVNLRLSRDSSIKPIIDGMLP